MSETAADTKTEKPQSIIALIHQNTSYKVSKKQFSSKSKIFSYFENSFCTRFIIPDIFSIATVQSFIKFIETSQVRVKVDNCIEFLSLSEILGCERIANKAIVLTSNVPKEEIITQYTSFLTHNIDSFTVQKIIIQNFGYYSKYKKDLLVKLPVNKLCQILQKSLIYENSLLTSNTTIPFPIDMSDLLYLCASLVHEYGNLGLQILSLVNIEKASDESLSNLACELQFIEQTPQVSMIINYSSIRENKESELKKVWNLLYQSVVSPSSKDDPKLEVANMLQYGKYLPQNSREYMNIILQLVRNKNPKAQFIYSQMLTQQGQTKSQENGNDSDNFNTENFKSTFGPTNSASSSNLNSPNLTKNSASTISNMTSNVIKNGEIINSSDSSINVQSNQVQRQRRMSTSSSSPNLSSNAAAAATSTNSNSVFSVFSAIAAASITPLGATSVSFAQQQPSSSVSPISHPAPMTPEERDSLRYLKMSADKNYEPAILKLSELIIRDRTLLKTRGMLKYIQKASLLGDSNAQLILGTFYRDGVNIKQDLGIARELFAISAYHQNINGLIQYIKLNNTNNKHLFFLLISTGNVELVSAYIGFDHTVVNSLDYECWSVAHYAAFVDNDQTDMIEYLYNSFNVGLDEVTITGARPIHLACLKGNLNVVKFLLKNGDPKSVHKMTYKKELPIHFACKSGNIKLVEFLLEECNCIGEILTKTADNWTCLHFACDRGSHFIAHELLKLDNSHSSINALTNERETPLHLACKSGNYVLVNKLLKIPGVVKQFFTAQTIKKANVLHFACLSGNQKLIHFVFSSLSRQFGSDVINMKTTSNENILHYACLSGKASTVSYVNKLTNKKIDLGEKTIFNESLLHYACKSGSDEIVNYLKKRHDFDVSQKNIVFFSLNFFVYFVFFVYFFYGISFYYFFLNENCLHVACKTRNFNLIQLLISMDKDLLETTDVLFGIL